MTAGGFAYLVLLVGCGIFYLMYGQWLGWILLLAMGVLPWLSLGVSLPGILTFQGQIWCSGTVTLGQEAQGWLGGSSRFPLPPFSGTLVVESCGDGQSFACQQIARIPTGHCGGYRIRCRKLRVRDYLGLFSFRGRPVPEQLVLIRPRPVPVAALPELERYLSAGWRPKPGGGFSENHELRPYRPGDPMNQIHWKLTAKTGTWVIREPMEPLRRQAAVSMDYAGTPEERDRKLGRLLWTGTRLLEKGVVFHLKVTTGQETLQTLISHREQLEKILDQILCAPVARSETEPEPGQAGWHYHIGGEPDDPV